MKHTKDEALKLMLAVLKSKDTWGSSIREAKERSIAAAEEALAQPTSGDYALGYAEGFNDACKTKPAPVQEPVAQAWAEGYRAGIDDERTSEANIGIAGMDMKVEPARNNPYRTTPPAAQPAPVPLTDEEIVWLVPGLLDCLCDPYDYNKSGNSNASIRKDMVRLARAIEAVVRSKNT
jgi:hypothetical protein